LTQDKIMFFDNLSHQKKIKKIERKSLKNRNKSLNCKSKIISQ